ncbi:thioredoxin-like protein [Leucosporidium creatinivorum]|uniref:Thioredoxin-like protein n=1 Tax=Leucosporidium creatinivorum TaxID=106004 RepID=A0A1Y2F1H0_9BASI|nr:thioredoxin-like protein [Leucosporidium creatinivorum]
MASPIEIASVSAWNEALRSSKAAGKTVAVDFHATWCGPCKTIAPIYANLAKQYPQVTFLRVDVDKVQPVAQKYKVAAMPTFLAIKGEQGVVDTLKGADPQGLTNLIARHAGPNPPVAPLPPKAEEAKAKGTEAFKAGDWATAVEFYGKAIEEAPDSAALYANRSVTLLNHLSSPSPASLPSAPNPLELALSDARKATELLPSWGKGWVRLGEALVASVAAGGDAEQRQEAVKAFELAVERSEGTVKKEARLKLHKAKQEL